MMTGTGQGFYYDRPTFNYSLSGEGIKHVNCQEFVFQ